MLANLIWVGAYLFTYIGLADGWDASSVGNSNPGANQVEKLSPGKASLTLALSRRERGKSGGLVMLVIVKGPAPGQFLGLDHFGRVGATPCGCP